MSIRTPDWVKDAVFYQIFPDRFARSPRTQSMPGVNFKPWGTPPQEQGFQGGDLRGIVDKLGYLKDLGITALYLNPIFASASNHRYHTYDYMQVDPLLGGNEAFRELLDECHAQGIRVVIDGVFNHASRGFWAFHHILEEGGNSPYLDWFTVHDWPLRPYEHSKEKPHNYAAWWGIPALPKFNVSNPGVRQYLLDVARYWIEFGADGWRLDVPEEINDPDFWRTFRKIVKEANPDAYITGEIWHPAPEWLQGDRFDSVMNYLFSRAAINYFGAKTLHADYRPGGYALNPLNTRQFSIAVKEMLAIYDWEINLAQLNLIDSHDTARTLWMVGGDESALRLCTLFQMTIPGAPCIYYGDEIGMTGGHEPESRAAFPWHEEASWDLELRDFYKRAIAMRHQHPALRTGDFHPLHARGNVYAFLRTLNDDQMIVIFNIGARTTTFDLKLIDSAGNAPCFDAVWGQGSYVGQQGILSSVSVPGRSALVLKRKEEN